MFSQSAADWNSKEKEKENNNSRLIRFPNPFWKTWGLSPSQAVQKKGQGSQGCSSMRISKRKTRGVVPAGISKIAACFLFTPATPDKGTFGGHLDPQGWSTIQQPTKASSTASRALQTNLKRLRSGGFSHGSTLVPVYPCWYFLCLLGGCWVLSGLQIQLEKKGHGDTWSAIPSNTGGRLCPCVIAPGAAPHTAHSPNPIM